MEKLDKLGKVYTTDVLILGGGLAGMSAAHGAKNSGQDVLVADRCYFGYTGQSTRAGHGLCFMKPEDKIENLMYYAITMNKDGLWLNDQDVLLSTSQEQYTYPVSYTHLDVYKRQVMHMELQHYMIIMRRLNRCVEKWDQHR